MQVFLLLSPTRGADFHSPYVLDFKVAVFVDDKLDHLIQLTVKILCSSFYSILHHRMINDGRAGLVTGGD